MWGSDIISKEERDKTVEYLTLPVTRARLLTAKDRSRISELHHFIAGYLGSTW